MKIKRIEMMEDVVQSSKLLMERLQNVIQQANIFVAQNGDFVGSLQNIVIARNVLTLGKVAP